MHITGMTISGIPPISQRIALMFDNRVNVLAGPNASGKSTILRWILDRINWAVPHSWLLEYLDESSKMNRLGVSEDWRESDMGSLVVDRPPPVIVIGSSRPLLPKLSDTKTGDKKFESADEILEGDFSGTRVKQAIDALREEVWAIEPDNSPTYVTLKGTKWTNYYKYPERGNLLKVNEITDECVKSICSEVVRGSSSYNYVPGPDVRGYLLGPRGAEPITVHLDIGVDTSDIRNFDNLSKFEAPSASAYHQGTDSLPIYAADLSDGTQGTLLWIRWLALKMVSHYEFRTDWEEMPAILLIDEIENHLHPTWQRRVIPALLEHFPGLQIFATTHSPFVVAGLRAGQVHMLKRDADGVVTASTNEQDIIGWTTDEILRTFMGVDDPTDDATAAAARELRQLRDEGPRDVEDAEAERQERMQELRRLVDRDLLAGGPMAARRELFEQQFAEALEKYRQSRDLGQDSG